MVQDGLVEKPPTFFGANFLFPLLLHKEAAQSWF